MHYVRPSGPMRDVHNLEVALRHTADLSVSHSYKPLQICERNSLIVMAEKLLITL